MAIKSKTINRCDIAVTHFQSFFCIEINAHIKKSNDFLFFFFYAGNWEDNWIYSKAEGKEFGKFELTAGKFFNDAENDKGM